MPSVASQWRLWHQNRVCGHQWSLLVKLVSGRVMVLHQALLVPGIAANLISSLQLYDNHGATTMFGQGAILSRNGTVIATGTRLGKHL